MCLQASVRRSRRAFGEGFLQRPQVLEGTRVDLRFLKDVLNEMLTFGIPGCFLKRTKGGPRALIDSNRMLLLK